MRRPDPKSARALRLLVLDVDGVMTDGALYFGPRGEVMKAFNVRDGHGIKLLQAAGVSVAVISGRRSAAVAKRCRDLKVRYVFQGVEDKGKAFLALLARLRITAAQAACIGDDTPDIPMFALAGFAVAVRDAHPLARDAAHRVTTLPGGRGAVREVCDWLLDARSRS